MGCPLSWHAFAALVLVLLSKGKFSGATLTVRMPSLHACLSAFDFFFFFFSNTLVEVNTNDDEYYLPARHELAPSYRALVSQFVHAHACGGA